MRAFFAKLLRNWLTWLMVLILVSSLAVWFFTRVTIPHDIRIGTAVPGGVYFEEGRRLKEALERRSTGTVEVVPTSGSQDNLRRLRNREIDVAIMQSGSGSLRDLAVVTPLHRDVVHVLVRHELLDKSHGTPPIESVRDLAGHTVIIGLPDSGMQHTARLVLKHYRIEDQVELREVHFTKLFDTEETYHAAIVTTGVENDDVRKMLSSGEFGLLPLDAKALAKRFSNLEFYEIPAQLWPPVPQTDVPTVAATALVVVREDAPPTLVTQLLDSIYEENLPEEFPTMFTQEQAKAMTPARLHYITRRYHDPFHQYGVMHDVLESLVAGKELLVALAAATYLGWNRWRRLKEQENQARISEQKERLDRFLDQTLQIEREQMDAIDPVRLQVYLDKVTEIKLAALNELTHEDLRGDRTFAIFLMQCANLISKIQLKIINYTDRS